MCCDGGLCPQLIESSLGPHWAATCFHHLDHTCDGVQVPEGAVRFELTAEEIAEALAEESVEVAAPEDIPVPDALLPEEEVRVLVAERRPAYVPVDGGEAVRN